MDKSLTKQDVKPPKRVKTGGRQVGTPNKVTSVVREGFLEVFERLGGVDHMLQWATENPSAFYNLFAKLAPRAQEGTGGKSPVAINIVSYRDDEKHQGVTIDGERLKETSR